MYSINKSDSTVRWVKNSLNLHIQIEPVTAGAGTIQVLDQKPDIFCCTCSNRDKLFFQEENSDQFLDIVEPGNSACEAATLFHRAKSPTKQS